MSGVISLKMLGRFGNQAMQYLFARAHAERVGAELKCESWIGEEVFSIPRLGEYSGPALPRRTSFDLKPDETDVELRCYAQNPVAMIYTSAQARQWLPFRRPRDEVLDRPDVREIVTHDWVVGHIRRGDFVGYSYPLVSLESYKKCIRDNGLLMGMRSVVCFTTEENPTPSAHLPKHLSFLPDFYRLVDAPIMLRANSSFSWLAGLLNTRRVFSPIIDGLRGGVEQDCRWVEGNWPKLVDHEGFGDLHVKP